jgi:hypothetical protein
MQALLALKNEDGDSAKCALRITKNPEGRIQACKVSEEGKPLGASADITPQAMDRLQALAFAQTCWLPNQEEPTLRITGQGKMVEIRENRASSEPTFVSLEELQGVLQQVVVG